MESGVLEERHLLTVNNVVRIIDFFVWWPK